MPVSVSVPDVAIAIECPLESPGGRQKIACGLSRRLFMVLSAAPFRGLSFGLVFQYLGREPQGQGPQIDNEPQRGDRTRLRREPQPTAIEIAGGDKPRPYDFITELLL